MVLKKDLHLKKEKLVAVQPQLDELRKKNNERLKLFADVKMQIQKVLIDFKLFASGRCCGICNSKGHRSIDGKA